MFDRFNWFTFDPARYFEDSSSRSSRGQQLANAWSVWTDLSKQYQTAFLQGDETAIQKFARRSNYVLSAPWVLAVLQRWQAEATPAAKRKIRRVIAGWLDSRGKRAPKKLFDTIRRDKKIECEVLERVLQKKTKEVALEEVSGSTGENESVVEEIHREYWKRGKRLFLHNSGRERPERAFRKYLLSADPEKLWRASLQTIDKEAAAFFLDQELKRMAHEGSIALDDFRPIEWTTGRFFDELFWRLNHEPVSLKLFRKSLPPDDDDPGDYIYMEIIHSARRTQKVAWEWNTDRRRFEEIRAVDSEWYRDLLKKLQ